MTTGLNFSSSNRFVFNFLKLHFLQNGRIFDTFWPRVLPWGFRDWDLNRFMTTDLISSSYNYFVFNFFEVMFSSKWLDFIYFKLRFPENGRIFDTFWQQVLPSGFKNWQGVSCDRFLGRTHAPRTSRYKSARTRVRTSNLKGSHFAPAPAHFW